MALDEIAAVLGGKQRWCILHGDCLDVLPTLPERSVDHVITDPPYCIDWGKAVTAGSSDDFAVRKGPLSKRAAGYAAFGNGDVARVGPRLAANCRRWCLVWHEVEGGHLWRGALCPPLRYVRTGCWARSNPCPQFSGDRPAQGFELCTIAHSCDERMRWNGGGHAAHWRYRQQEGVTRDIDHPTPKPLLLMLDLVRLFTDPGEVILDPFCGSGTTGVAALRLGRRFIGVELNAGWAALARDRLLAEDRGSTLAALRSGQEALFR